MVAAYETTPDAMGYPYVYPCETGNRTGCRWLTVTNSAGAGLLFSAGDAPLQCAVLYHTAEQLRSQKKWTRSYYELLLPQYRTQTPVVRVCHDVTGMGMGLATDYIAHSIASGAIYRYTMGLQPIRAERAYPALPEVSRQLRRSAIPDSLISGLLVSGKPAEDFCPGMRRYTLEVTRTDFEALGEAALPPVSPELARGAVLKTEPLLPDKDTAKALRLGAQYLGAEESVEVFWRLVDKKALSALPFSASRPELVTIDRSYYGGSLKALRSAGRGPTFRQTQTAYPRGICVAAGQTASMVEVTFAVSEYTARGYETLRGLVNIAPDQKRLNTHGFNIDFEVARLHYTIEADGVLCAEGVCTPGGDSREICCRIGKAATLTLSVALLQEGFFKDTALDFCDLRLSN